MAFENEKFSRQVSELLESSGAASCLTCSSGDQVRRLLGRQAVYCVVCGPHLADGPAEWLAEDLPPECSIEGLNDSKQVTPKRRDALYDTIRTVAVAWAVARVEAEEIDATDILSARIKAMQMAIDRLEPAPGFALIDGNRDHGKTAAILLEHQTVVKGDSLSASIAAASILAKVSRDRYMEQMAERYPEYEFERHKGYGTKRHYELLRRYGPCPIHRRTFLKKL